MGFVILPGGLGDGEWVILIKAYCLLPLVYWDDAKQRGTRTSLVEVILSYTAAHDFFPNRNYLEGSGTVATYAVNDLILLLVLVV